MKIHYFVLLVATISALSFLSSCGKTKFTECREALTPEACKKEKFEKGTFRCAWDSSAQQGKGECKVDPLHQGDYDYN